MHETCLSVHPGPHEASANRQVYANMTTPWSQHQQIGLRKRDDPMKPAPTDRSTQTRRRETRFYSYNTLHQDLKSPALSHEGSAPTSGPWGSFPSLGLDLVFNTDYVLVWLTFTGSTAPPLIKASPSQGRCPMAIYPLYSASYLIHTGSTTTGWRRERTNQPVDLQQTVKNQETPLAAGVR